MKKHSRNSPLEKNHRVVAAAFTVTPFVTVMVSDLKMKNSPLPLSFALRTYCPIERRGE